MASSEASTVGVRLDEHHAPETNGRMPVCRRCGAQTNGSAGKNHLPDEGHLERYTNWLDAQLRIGRIDRSREVFAKEV